MSTSIISYPIFKDLKVILGLLGGSTSKDKSVSVTWDLNKTTVTSAKFSINAIVDWVPSDYIIYLNGNEIYRKDFPLFSDRQDIQSIDVLSFLANGVNEISVTFEDIIGGATLLITVTLNVEFTGEIPKAEPTILGLTPVQLALVGGGALTLIAILSRK